MTLMINAAFDGLDSMGLRYQFRKASCRAAAVRPGEEVDISLDRSSIASADAALKKAAFYHLRTFGDQDHRFYLAFSDGLWLKIDAKLRPSSRPMPGWIAKFVSHLPLSIRRQGPVVAVLGLDGAGKGTVIDRLRREIPIAVTVRYLGERPRAARLTRSRLAQDVAVDSRRPGALRESLFVLKRAVRFAIILCEAYAAAWAGRIVVCDRHPMETLAVRPRETAAAAWLEATIFGRLLPRPDLVIMLDAPAAVLYARKREHPVDDLVRLRQSYLDTFASSAVVVSTDQPIEDSVHQVSEQIWRALCERRNW